MYKRYSRPLVLCLEQINIIREHYKSNCTQLAKVSPVYGIQMPSNMYYIHAKVLLILNNSGFI